MIKKIISNIFLLVPNFILSLPFTIFGLTKYLPNEIKSPLQPPGYIFAIVWPILYLLFGIINYRAMYSKQISDELGDTILISSLVEAIGQTLWLLVTANFGYGRIFLQHLFGLFIMFYLSKFAYHRFILFNNNDQIIKYLYIPYFLWINFALILNIDLVLQYF